eukprot:760379-Hanusia_phi.AAC.1
MGYYPCPYPAPMYPPPSPYANGCFTVTLACFQSNTTGEKVEPPFNINFPRDYFSGRPPSLHLLVLVAILHKLKVLPVPCFTSSPYGFSQATQMTAQLFRDDPALAQTWGEGGDQHSVTAAPTSIKQLSLLGLQVVKKI